MRQKLLVIHRVARDALGHFNNDDGWAMASHVAMSVLLAAFPFLIFATSLASFLGAGVVASSAVDFIFDTVPEIIAKPMYSILIWFICVTNLCVGRNQRPLMRQNANVSETCYRQRVSRIYWSFWAPGSN